MSRRRKILAYLESLHRANRIIIPCARPGPLVPRMAFINRGICDRCQGEIVFTDGTRAAVERYREALRQARKPAGRPAYLCDHCLPDDDFREYLRTRPVLLAAAPEQASERDALDRAVRDN